jgi:hypothetical protein
VKKGGSIEKIAGRCNKMTSKKKGRERKEILSDNRNIKKGNISC